MAMNLPKINRPQHSSEVAPENFISCNFLFVKGKLTDPKTQRLLLVLAFLLLGNVSPENIPYLKSLIEVIKHLI